MEVPIELKKLDAILHLLIDHTTRQLSWINDRLNAVEKLYQNSDELKVALRHLTEEGYVFNIQTTSLYVIQLRGILFIKSGGYEAKFLRDAVDADLHQRELDRVRIVDDLSGKNQTRLNNLTRWLVIGTIAAAAVGIALLVWQIYVYYHPEPIPVEVKIKSEKHS